MFERFTDRARRVVVLAQDEARMLKHTYVGTEHILLGLIHEGEGVAGPRERGLPPEIAARLGAIDSRLSAVEQRAGTGPDTGELDQQIEQTRRDRQAAVDAQEYERAASLRDREKGLIAEQASRQQQWAATHPDLPSLAEKLSQLGDEIERLRALLREHGIEPKDGAA
jgi:ATP-dependent Clp protease ATP-binding subunit ClpA